MITYFKDTETIALLLLAIFLIGFFNESLTTFKGIGIIGASLIALYNITTKRKMILDNIITIFNINKVLLLSLSLFLIVIFTSSLFAYSNSLNSLYSFYKEIKYPLLFTLITFTIVLPKNILIKLIIVSIVLSTLALNFHFLFKDLQNYNNIFHGLIKIDRFFSTFFEVIFPFSIVLFLTHKNKFIKYIIFFFSILLGLILLLYTGARGSWLTIFVEISIILVYLIIKNKSILYANKNYFIFSIVFGIMSILYLYNYISLIHNKINQGTQSSGRNIILQDRFPIFMKSNNKILGLGYGTNNYIKFMNDQNAPKRLGIYKKDKKLFLYWHDEPFLLSIFYHYGILGFLSILIFIIYFILSNIKLFSKLTYKDEILYQVAIFSSMFCLFFIRGLFENMHLKYILILFAMYIITNSYNREKNENSLYLS